MGIREERRAERRNAVLNAAMDLIEKEGVHGVTIAAVAKEIGASVGGMYRYFPNKRAIFVALQLRSIGYFRDFMLTQLKAVEGQQALLRVRTAFEAWPRFQEEAPQHYGLLDEFLSLPERTLDDQQAAAVQVELLVLMKEIAALIEAAAQAGALREGDAMARAHLLWAALHGLQHFRKRDPVQPESLRTASLQEQLFETFFRAWGWQSP